MTYTHKDDYTPRFKIGEVVQFYDVARRQPAIGTIAERKVTRRNNHCSTLYTLDNGDVRSEYALDHTSVLLSPGDWADRFPAAVWQLNVTGETVGLKLVYAKGEAFVSALVLKGKVQAIGNHKVTVTLNGESPVMSSHADLGSALVAVMNALT